MGYELHIFRKSDPNSSEVVKSDGNTAIAAIENAVSKIRTSQVEHIDFVRVREPYGSLSKPYSVGLDRHNQVRAEELTSGEKYDISDEKRAETKQVISPLDGGSRTKGEY